ncbi:MAG TPA: hypothetical protein VF077_08895 [Nitrospiraceae bacterium]
MSTFDYKKLTLGIMQRPNGEWLGTIIQNEPDGTMCVLTVGVEDTEDAIIKWGAGTLDLMHALQRGDVELPDKYDRAKPN